MIMKKNIFYSILVLLTLTVVLTSCSKDGFDDIQGGEAQIDTNVYYEIKSDTAVKVADLMNQITLPEGGMVSMDIIENQIKMRELMLQSKIGKDNVQIGLRKVVYHYNSVDVQGEPITLSAAAFMPGYFDKNVWYDMELDNICLMEHYTITSNAESPSMCFPLEVFITNNTLVLMPDYIGYGVTKNMLHPYLNHELCAINSVDAFPAGYAVFKNLSAKGLKSDWKLYVTGASQGAGNALAVHKYLDTHSDIARNWKFAATNCSSGPYSPIKTMEKYFADGKTALPVVFPLTLKSMLASYPELMDGFSEEMMYSNTYLEVKNQIDEMISSKQYTTAEINLFFMENVKKTFADGLADDEILLVDILSDDMLNPHSDIMKALNNCFDNNDLIKGWTPVHPIKMHYSTGDRIVSSYNALAAKEAFGSKVTLTPTSTPMEHMAACAMWMAGIFMMGL